MVHMPHEKHLNTDSELHSPQATPYPEVRYLQFRTMESRITSTLHDPQSTVIMAQTSEGQYCQVRPALCLSFYSSDLCRFVSDIFQPQPGQEESSRIFRSVRPSPSLNGFHHLGDDGVLRSYSSQGVVRDYKCLSPDEIAAVIATTSASIPQEEAEKIAKIMEGVDGRAVSDINQILNPPPEIRPPVAPAREEHTRGQNRP